MTVPTVLITCKSVGPVSSAYSGATFTATLDQSETYLGESVLSPVTAIADTNGVAILSLWPNTLGTKNSVYRIVGTKSGTGEVFRSVTVRVSNANSNLDAIQVTVPILPTVTVAQALIDTQSVLININVSRTAAQDAAAASLLSQNLAKISETNSGTNKDLIKTYSDSALNSNNSAAANALISTNQAVISTAQALAAANSALVYGDMQEAFMAQAVSMISMQSTMLTYAKFRKN